MEMEIDVAPKDVAPDEVPIMLAVGSAEEKLATAKSCR